MPKLHTSVLGLAALAASGAAAAELPQWHTRTVELPDGSTAEISYVGDVAPNVVVAMDQNEPPRTVDQNAFDFEGFGDRPSRPRWKRGNAASPARHAVSPGFFVSGDMPAGTRHHYTVITTASDGRICVQRTEWISHGPRNPPEVRRSDAGEGCAPAAYALTSPSPTSSPATGPQIPTRPRSAIPTPLKPVDPDTGARSRAE